MKLGSPLSCFSPEVKQQTTLFQEKILQEKKRCETNNTAASRQKCAEKFQSLERTVGLQSKLSSGAYTKIGGHQEFLDDFHRIVTAFKGDTTLGIEVCGGCLLSSIWKRYERQGFCDRSKALRM